MLGYKWLIVYCLSVICHIELFPVKLFFSLILPLHTFFRLMCGGLTPFILGLSS